MSTGPRSRRRRRPPRRGVVSGPAAVAVVLPPLALGGIHGAVQVLAAVAAAAALAAWLLSPAPVRRVPRGAWIFGALAAWALVQSLPGSHLLAGGATAPIPSEVASALAGTGVSPYGAAAPNVADARLGAVRLAALWGIFMLGRYLGRTAVAALLACSATVSALAAYVHGATGATRLLGFYRPVQVDLASAPHLPGTFVNPNHQAAFYLLGLGALAALGLRAARRGGQGGRDIVLACAVAAAVVLPALAATLSRSGIALVPLLALGAGWQAYVTRRKRATSNPSKTEPPRLVLAGSLAAAAVVTVLFVRVGASALADLGGFLRAPEAIAQEPKLRLLRESLPMFRLAPLAGIGAGTFVDLWPRYAEDPTAPLAVHLESALLGPSLAHGWAGLAATVAAVLVPMAAYRRARRDGDGSSAVLSWTLVLAGVEGTFDHWWASLGVAGPAAALAGALAPPADPHRRKRLVHAPLLSAVVLIALGIASYLPVRSERFERRLARNAAIEQGAQAASALRLRPLDARLHTALGRQRARTGDWSAACRHAATAARLDPGDADPRFLLASCALRRGDRSQAAAHLARGLHLLPEAPNPELAGYLARAFSPEDLAGAVTGTTPWRGLVRILSEPAPRHTVAVLDAVERLHPQEDLAPTLAIRIRIRLLGEIAAARKQAAALVRRLPDRPSAYTSWVAAARAARDGEPAIRRFLRRALERNIPPRTRDTVEELLAQSLAKGDARDRRTALAIVDRLIRRAPDTAARLRLGRLRSRLRAEAPAPAP